MKRLLQLFLAGVFLLSFSAQARVILPKGGEEWSVGSSVQLQWQSSGESVTIRLIRPDQEPIVIAEDVADTGHYLWEIPAITGDEGDALVPARDYRIKITQDGAKTRKSRTFRIMAWAWDTKQDLGKFDENDRSRVTHPRQAAVLDKDNPTVTINWVDYRHFLRNNIRIRLYEVGKLRQLGIKTGLDNIGSYEWQLDERSIEACSARPCYFVVRSGRKRNHLITSHSFTLGDVGDGGDIEITEAVVGPSKDSAAPGSVLTLGWTGPEGETRIDLYQAGYYHQTIKEEVFPVDDEGESHLSWAIPATLPGGEDYTVVLTSLADGAKPATSTPFSIEAAEDSVTVNPPKDITLGQKSTRLSWKNTQGPVDIDLYRDGRRVKTIARNTSPTRVHNWRLPGVLAGSDQYTVRVTQADEPKRFGVSALFKITAPGDDGVARPSQKRCEAAGLEAGCTSSAINNERRKARLQQVRDCVTYRLYDQDCTEERLATARQEYEALLAVADQRMTSCPEGLIRIGASCRPESQCPGLDLLDAPSSQRLDGIKSPGPRRCDQNLIRAVTEADRDFAVVIRSLLNFLRKSERAQTHKYLSKTLYDLTMIGGNHYLQHLPHRSHCDYKQVTDFRESERCQAIKEAYFKDKKTNDTSWTQLGSRVKPWLKLCDTQIRPRCNAWGVISKSSECLGGSRYFTGYKDDDLAYAEPQFEDCSERTVLMSRTTFLTVLYVQFENLLGSEADRSTTYMATEAALVSWAREKKKEGDRFRNFMEGKKTVGWGGEVDPVWAIEEVFKVDISDEEAAKIRDIDRPREYVTNQGFMGGLSGYITQHIIEKGFYWPDEPVVAPEAFDTLDDAGRWHAEFIWRTSEFRKALYGGDPIAPISGIVDRYMLSSIQSGSQRNDLTVPGISRDKSLDCLADRESELKPGCRQLTPDRDPWLSPPLVAKLVEEATWDLLHFSETKAPIIGATRLPEEFEDFESLSPCYQGGVVVDGRCVGVIRPKPINCGGPGTGLDVDSCASCPPGYFNRDGVGACLPCRGNLVTTDSGRDSCSLCPMNQVPKRKHDACMDNPCTRGEYWDGATRSCEKDARKRHKWIQMTLIDIEHDLIVSQMSQMYDPAVITDNKHGGALPALEALARARSESRVGPDFVYEICLVHLESSSRNQDHNPPTFPGGINEWMQIREGSSCSDLTIKAGDKEPERSKRWHEHWPGHWRWDGWGHRDNLPTPYCLGKTLQECNKEHPKLKLEGIWPNESHRGSKSDGPGSSNNSQTLVRLLRDSRERHDKAQIDSGKRQKAVFALHLNGHGTGFEAAGVKMDDMRRIIREELGDSRLNLITFDSCLMGNYETLLMMDGVTDWLVGHTTQSPASGWGGEVIVNMGQPKGSEFKYLSTKDHVSNIIDESMARHFSGVRQREYMTSIVGYRMAEFGAFREAFNGVLNHLAKNIDPHKGELIDLYRQQLNHIKVMHPKDPMPAHFKYDVRAFLEGVMGFNNPEDLKLTKFARRALRRLKPLTLQPEGWEETQSPMGFVWRPRMDALEKTGYEKINGELNHYLNLPVDDRGKLKSGWEPLQALVNFDQVWQTIAPKDDGLAVIVINPGS